MTEREVKRHLEVLLESYTLGSVIHLLADRLHVQAEQARREDDAAMYDRCITAKHALIVFGLGIDAACPS